MKITGPRPSQSTSTARRPSKAGGAGFAPSEPAPETRSAPTVAGPAGVASVDALLALQGAPDAADPRKRSAARAGDILDALEGVKLAMLEGGSPAAALARLAQSTRQARAKSADPRLEAIVDQVEVRAAVELAKRAIA